MFYLNSPKFQSHEHMVFTSLLIPLSKLVGKVLKTNSPAVLLCTKQRFLIPTAFGNISLFYFDWKYSLMEESSPEPTSFERDC